jgi:sugar/nucleoside kinase (ribokinase family)
MKSSPKSGKKVVVAGHICLDIAPIFPESCRGEGSKLFAPGRLISVEDAQIHIGGSVGNTGLAMSFFGANVRLLGKIGRDEFGEIAAHIVNSYGILEEMIVSNESHTSYSIVIALPGQDRFFLHYPGANDTFAFDDLDLGAFQGVALFHFGYPPVMKRMYRDDGLELTKLFHTISDLGVVTSLDMSAVDPTSPAGQVDWERIIRKTLPYVDIFAPSVEELLYMLDQETFERLENEANGRDLTTVVDLDRDVKPLAEKTIKMGAKIVLIKCGEPGLYFRTADHQRLSIVEEKLGFPLDGWSNREGFEQSYVADRVLSTTGAGDVTIAAFLTSLLYEYSLETCLHYATGAGACCVTEYDAISGLISFQEMQAKIDAGWRKRRL